DRVVVLEQIVRQGRGERRRGHGLLRVRHLGTDRAATLVEVLGRLVEDPLAPPPPDARPIRGQEPAIEAPGDVAVDDLDVAHPAAVRNRLSKSSWLMYAPHSVRLPVYARRPCNERQLSNS